MHKLYNNDGKLRIVHGISKEEAIIQEKILLEENKFAITSSNASDDTLIWVISRSSQNALSFYPEKLYLDEAIKRGLDIKDIVSSLPLLSKDTLFVPKGVELWSEGKEYKIF